MNTVFFLTILALCSANDAFSQDQVLAADKKTATGKESKVAGLSTVSGSTANGSGTCTLDMNRSTAPGAAVNTGNLVLQADTTLPQKVYSKDRIITTPGKDEH